MGQTTAQQQEYESPRIERVGTIAELTGGGMWFEGPHAWHHHHHHHPSGN